MNVIASHSKGLALERSNLSINKRLQIIGRLLHSCTHATAKVRNDDQ